MFVDYNYYSNVYRGEVGAERFEVLELKARAILNYYTFNRIKDVSENVKLAICEIIDVIEEGQEDKQIVSETVDTHSKTYALKEKESEKKKYIRIIKTYLGHTGFLYRGFLYDD